jgi:hypothetical protein
MATPGTVGGASNGLLLFGLTTAFLFAIGSDLRGGAAALVFLGFKKNLGDADHRFLA